MAAVCHGQQTSNKPASSSAGEPFQFQRYGAVPLCQPMASLSRAWTVRCDPLARGARCLVPCSLGLNRACSAEARTSNPNAKQPQRSARLASGCRRSQSYFAADWPREGTLPPAVARVSDARAQVAAAAWKCVHSAPRRVAWVARRVLALTVVGVARPYLCEEPCVVHSSVAGRSCSGR